MEASRLWRGGCEVSDELDAIDAKLIAGFRQGLEILTTEVADFIRSQDRDPLPGSQATRELLAFPHEDALSVSWSSAFILIELGAEHVSVFLKTLKAPIENIACCTCIRSMLEACSIGAWLVDPAIDPEIRAKRAFAYRYEGMSQQLTLAQTVKANPGEIQKCKDRIDQVENRACALGFPKVVNKRGERIGIGQQMPSATSIIELVMGDPHAYRLLSAVAHGHMWAITQLCYKKAESIKPSPGYYHLEKSLNIKGFAMLSVSAISALSRPVWNLSRYFGWDLLRIEEIFEKAADAMELDNSFRFWRSP